MELRIRKVLSTDPIFLETKSLSEEIAEALLERASKLRNSYSSLLIQREKSLIDGLTFVAQEVKKNNSQKSLAKEDVGMPIIGRNSDMETEITSPNENSEVLHDLPPVQRNGKESTNKNGLLETGAKICDLLDFYTGGEEATNKNSLFEEDDKICDLIDLSTNEHGDFAQAIAFENTNVCFYENGDFLSSRIPSEAPKKKRRKRLRERFDSMKESIRQKKKHRREKERFKERPRKSKFGGAFTDLFGDRVYSPPANHGMNSAKQRILKYFRETLEMFRENLVYYIGRFSQK